MDELERELERASRFSQREEYAQALKICDNVIKDHPNNSRGYRERAYVNAFQKKHEKAVDDIGIAISLDPIQPAYYFLRALCLLNCDRPEEACQDLSEVLSLEERFGRGYYVESAYFYRAAAYLDLGLYKEALQDCRNVKDGFVVYMKGGRRSKEDIERDARAERLS